MTKPIIHRACDYVTVVTMDVPTGKSYRLVDGKIKKTPAANNANGWAQTVPVTTATEMANVVRQMSVNVNQALILGFIQGTEDGEPYRLMSSNNFAEMADNANIKTDKWLSKPIIVNEVKYATRTKRMFHASAWFGFDRDTVDGMPVELEPQAGFARWWEMMNTMIPEIRNCSYVAVKSASCRVSLDGVPMESTNAHVYMKAKDATDTERFGKAGMVHSFARGYGFMRDVKDRNTGEVLGQRPWTLYDPTTFSRERLFFDGSPIVDANEFRLAIEASDPIIFDGEYDVVNTRALTMPSKEEQKKWALELDVDSKGRVTIINPRDLTPDIEFDYHNRATGDRGRMTMAQFVSGDVDRLSCQSVFRPDSSSMAAYVSKEDGCHPFMYDVGTNVNYKYNNVAETFEDAIKSGLIKVNVEVVKDGGGLVVLDDTPTTTTVPRPPITIDNGADFNAGGDDVANLDPNAFVAPNLTSLPPLDNAVEPSTAMNIKTASSPMGYGAMHSRPDSAETDLGNAERYAWTFDGEFKYVPKFKEWFKWNGTRWIVCQGGEQRSAAQDMVRKMTDDAGAMMIDDSFRKWAKSSASTNAIGAMIKEASVMPNMIIGVDDMDDKWFNFGVANGYVDLRSNGHDGNGIWVGLDGIADKYDAELDLTLNGFMEPDRELFLTKSSDVKYVAGAKCPEWEKALVEIFSGDLELVELIQRLVGYSMCGNPVHEVIAFLVGNGSNGKSTITGVIEKVFGDYKKTVDKSVLMAKRGNSDGGQAATPALARLKDVRLAIVTETKEGDNIDESVVKALSGSDTITARHLHGDNFEFNATFVSWLATNHKPNIRSVDDGTWRRMLVIPFKRNFGKEMGAEKLDTGLKQRIIANEMSGVLNWCLEGVRQYYINGLMIPDSVSAANEDYKEEMDILSEWMDSAIEYGDGFEVTHTQLWESYELYSRRTGTQVIKTGRTLFAKLAHKGFPRVRHVKGHNQERGFSGLKIRLGED